MSTQYRRDDASSAENVLNSLSRLRGSHPVEPVRRLHGEVNGDDGSTWAWKTPMPAGAPTAGELDHVTLIARCRSLAPDVP